MYNVDKKIMVTLKLTIMEFIERILTMMLVSIWITCDLDLKAKNTNRSDLVLDVDVGAASEQDLDTLVLGVHTGVMERRQVITILVVHNRSNLK